MIKYNSIEIQENNLLFGPGKRAVLFTQGCSLKCPGCDNSHLWDDAGGKDLKTDDLLQICSAKDITGITLHGGEPMEQAGELFPVIKKIKAMKKSVILFTGHEIEELSSDNKLLKHCDIIKCGPFVEKKLNRFLHFRGSSNQRVIINPNGALRKYKVEDGTNTVLVKLDKECGNISVNGMVDDEMSKFLAEYANLTK